MLLIPCPWCGDRHESEFACGGPAHVARPAAPMAVSDADWTHYLYLARNPRGPHAERWCHVQGCRRWFNVRRDTVTHEIIAVYKMGEPPPESRS